nr:MAG TPA: helix-turn-helix domain protein [Caudoviricetes sp.]
MYRLNESALDQARKLHGLTSDEKLAAVLGMSGTAVRNLRKGRSSPSVVTLFKLRELTGIPIEALVTNVSAQQAA